MKKVLLIALIPVLCLIFSHQAAAQISVGGGLTYGLDIEDIGIQVGGTYDLTPEMRVGADIIYWLTGEDIDELGMGLEERYSTTFLEVNFNFNYLFHEQDALTLYGIGSLGVHYFSFKDELWVSGTSHAQDSFSDSDTEIGLGLGVGAEYDIGAVKLYAEPRIFLSGFDQFALAAGVRVPIN